MHQILISIIINTKTVMDSGNSNSNFELSFDFEELNFNGTSEIKFDFEDDIFKGNNENGFSDIFNEI